MRTVLLIPSVAKTELRGAIAADQHPRMDYDALAEALSAGADERVELLDYAAVDRERHPLVRAAHRLAGRDAALAALGFVKGRQCDAIFTNGENVGIPLALLLKATSHRARHVTIGHRLSAGKKRAFFRGLQVHRQMDRIFVYATTQHEHARRRLGIPAGKLARIAFHADDRFYRPCPTVPVDENQICSAGLEWRDYPTLIEAVADLPDLKVRLAAASPWSKHRDETAGRILPSNVDARRYDYQALRDLYARSAFVVVPLYENDFQAGVTTILEAMAMGKAIIATRTTGQSDVIVSGENGILVAAGDARALQHAVLRLRDDRPLRERLGRNARCWVEENGTLGGWVQQIACALRGGAARQSDRMRGLHAASDHHSNRSRMRSQPNSDVPS